MKAFDVLNRETNVENSFLIEASAGSGKTFSIENIVVRLIIEKGYALKDILALTFTKAAAQDLKIRIKGNIKKAIEQLKTGNLEWDYLKNICERGEEVKAKRELENAYFHFHEAEISTIHAFAADQLSKNPLKEGRFFAKIASSKDFETVIEDCILSEWPLLSEAEKEVLLEKKSEFEKLKNQLHKDAVKTRPIEPSETLDKFGVYSKLAAKCQTHLSRYRNENDVFTYDDILIELNERISDPEFLDSLKKRYKIAIIDEFQDTDALQWDIFQKIFSSEKPHLILVGDPKQSIYMFREADLYTYIHAARSFGEENIFSLSTNYRSHPHLVSALNHLFDPETPLFSLPKVQEFLHVQKALFVPRSEESSQIDSKGAVHTVFLTDVSKTEADSVIYPYLVKEIILLSKTTPFSEMAILVDNHLQGKKVEEVLTEANIPTVLQKSHKENVPCLKELAPIFDVCEDPRSEWTLKRALSSTLIGWDVEDILSLGDLYEREKWIWAFTLLKRESEKSFHHFLQAFLHSSFRKDGKNTIEWILSLKKGSILLKELEDLSLIFEGAEKPLKSTKDLLDWLDKKESDEKNSQMTVGQGVRIMTLHASKGLEFEVVFPIGLSKSHIKKDELILIDGVYKAAVKNSLDWKQLIEESDAEKMRLFYVAMTRAKKRVYLFVPQAKRKPSEGKISPLELFFKNRLGSTDFDKVKSFFHEAAKAFSFTCEEGKRSESSVLHTVSAIEPPQALEMSFKSLPFFSFTSLKVSRKAEFTEIVQTPENDIPGGKETGILFHKIFEKIPFRYLHKTVEDLSQFIHPYVKNSVLEPYLERISELILKSSETPLFTNGPLLKDLDESAAAREIAFLHSTPEGYMRGVIDLVFLWEGKYYILDWKTNLVEESVEKVMEQEDYYLQASIYKEALKTFLKAHEKKPLEEIFGGVLFFFLRKGEGCLLH